VTNRSGGPGLREKHRDPGEQKLCEKQRRKRTVAGYIARYAVRVRFEPRLNVHLYWGYRSLKTRPVRAHPVSLLEVEIHRRIATPRDDPPGRRLFLETQVSQQLAALRALEAVLAIQYVGGSAICTENGSSVGAASRSDESLVGNRRRSRRPPQLACPLPHTPLCRMNMIPA
jgi:hypothetical protein